MGTLVKSVEAALEALRPLARPVLCDAEAEAVRRVLLRLGELGP
jgi:hypothetical protein